ncbi:MAG TPA: redox-sensing transcriptional repressor Rex [Candidatus Sulfomarinibacteraceae bacterium]|nr:redox-sensing transcriptional repressor Rex [Candidatus Sulfomarinibacteraceae bacterium]
MAAKVKKRAEVSPDVVDEIPDIVIGRLPIYLRALIRLAEEGERTTTSSHELGERLGISSAQIRKDLSHFGEFGKQGTGYHIKYLIEQLQRILHLDQEWPMAIIGAGFLGHALANYGGFHRRGFRVGWIFDVDETKVGQKMGEITVQHVKELEETVRREKVQMAILALPPDAAQEITDRLVEAGVRAILTYAPINLTVPDGVHVQYSDPVVQLQRMTYYLNADG